MSRKCNTKHNRGMSNYSDRLMDRGISSRSVHMQEISNALHDTRLIEWGIKSKGDSSLGHVNVKDDE